MCEGQPNPGAARTPRKKMQAVVCCRWWTSGSSIVPLLALFIIASPLLVSGSAQFAKGGIVNGPLCPLLVPPELAPFLSACPPEGQCNSTSDCPGSMQCCLNIRVLGNSSQCKGNGCTCPNTTALCPSTSCTPFRHQTDNQSCSTCACVTGPTQPATSPANGIGLTNASASPSPTLSWNTSSPQSQTSASQSDGTTAPMTTAPTFTTRISFALYGAGSTAQLILADRVNFEGAVVHLLSEKYSLPALRIALEITSAQFLCCAANGQSYIPLDLTLFAIDHVVLQTTTNTISRDAHAKRIGFVYKTLPLTSGYLVTETSPPPATTGASSSDSTEQIIIYISAGVGGILLLLIVTALAISCKKKKGSVEFYEDAAPGVRFSPSTGVLDQTISPNYPGKAASHPGRPAAKPQLVFDQPLYESNADTEQLVT